jgi:hypothetical protein
MGELDDKALSQTQWQAVINTIGGVCTSNLPGSLVYATLAPLVHRLLIASQRQTIQFRWQPLLNVLARGWSIDLSGNTAAISCLTTVCDELAFALERGGCPGLVDSIVESCIDQQPSLLTGLVQYYTSVPSKLST